MNQLSKMSYNYIKSIKDKEIKILNYYKRINNLKEPKIFAVPKVKKGTKKNIPKDIKNIEDSKEEKEEKEEKKDTKDEKKLTRKRVVNMDD
jgi:hypothetical protein